MMQIYLIWGHDALEEEFLEQEYEEVQDEGQEEALVIKKGLGIGWFPNTDFDGLDNQSLFDYYFHPQITRQQGGDYVTTNKIILQASKTQ